MDFFADELDCHMMVLILLSPWIMLGVFCAMEIQLKSNALIPE